MIADFSLAETLSEINTYEKGNSEGLTEERKYSILCFCFLETLMTFYALIFVCLPLFCLGGVVLFFSLEVLPPNKSCIKDSYQVRGNMGRDT